MVWIIVLAVLVVGGIATFYIMRMLKGRLRIVLDKTGFAYDEPITGRITILAKKPIESTRLVVSLVAEETRRYRDRDDDEKTETREIFRNDVVIAGSKSYQAQETDEVVFSIPGAPGGVEGAGGGVGGAIKFGLEMMSGDRREVTWELVGRLDCPGLDLVHTVSLFFNPANP